MRCRWPDRRRRTAAGRCRLAVLQYWGAYDGGEGGLYAELGTSEKDGTDPRSMAKVLAGRGLESSWRQGMTEADLAGHLARGETVILDLQAWAEDDPTPDDYSDNWEDGHYVVLVGMDDAYLYVMDASLSAGYGYIARSELKARWRDYEDRGGVVWRNAGLGIVSRGGRGRQGFPPLCSACAERKKAGASRNAIYTSKQVRADIPAGRLGIRGPVRGLRPPRSPLAFHPRPAPLAREVIGPTSPGSSRPSWRARPYAWPPSPQCSSLRPPPAWIRRRRSGLRLRPPDLGDGPSQTPQALLALGRRPDQLLDAPALPRPGALEVPRRPPRLDRARLAFGRAGPPGQRGADPRRPIFRSCCWASPETSSRPTRRS